MECPPNSWSRRTTRRPRWMLEQVGATQCLWDPFRRSTRMCSLSPILFNDKIDWILGQALQDYPGVQDGANVHMSDLAYADEIVMLSSSYSEMHGLLEAVNRHAAAVGICSCRWLHPLLTPTLILQKTFTPLSTSFLLFRDTMYSFPLLSAGTVHKTRWLIFMIMTSLG